MITKFNRLDHVSIIELYNKLKSVKMVAKEFNSSEDLILKILNHHEIEIESTKFDRLDHQSIINSYLKFKTLAGVEKEFKISGALVKKVLNYYSIPLFENHNTTIRNKIDANYLIRRYNAQRNLRILSKEFNTSITLLTKILKSNNIEIKERIYNEKEIIDTFRECGSIGKTGIKLKMGDATIIKTLQKHNIRYKTLKRIKIGDVFGMLTVIGVAEPRISLCGFETKRYRCQCECGGETISTGSDLNAGEKWNCGCIWVKKRESVVIRKKIEENKKLQVMEEKKIKKNEILLHKQKKREEYKIQEKRWEIHIGDKFHRWTVIEIISKGKYRCKCKCGTIRVISHQNIRQSKSCGCLQKEISTTSGGLYSGKENKLMYARYKNMKKRCYNSSSPNYKYYGAIGIKVCDRWMESNGQGYINFCNDMGPRPGPEYSLDRKDCFGDYAPENCRWVTADIQSRNQRRYYKDVEYIKDSYEISKKIKE